jgi:hypothetical protein
MLASGQIGPLCIEAQPSIGWISCITDALTHIQLVRSVLIGFPYSRPDGGVNGAKVPLPTEPIPLAAQVLRPG